MIEMAKVPGAADFGLGEVQPAPANQQFVQANAAAEDFGGAAGKSASKFGESAKGLGDEFLAAALKQKAREDAIKRIDGEEKYTTTARELYDSFKTDPKSTSAESVKAFNATLEELQKQAEGEHDGSKVSMGQYERSLSKEKARVSEQARLHVQNVQDAKFNKVFSESTARITVGVTSGEIPLSTGLDMIEGEVAKIAAVSHFPTNVVMQMEQTATGNVIRGVWDAYIARGAYDEARDIMNRYDHVFAKLGSKKLAAMEVQIKELESAGREFKAEQDYKDDRYLRARGKKSVDELTEKEKSEFLFGRAGIKTEARTPEQKNAAALEAAIDEYGEDSPEVDRLEKFFGVDDKSDENATTQERNAAALEAAIEKHGEDSPEVDRLKEIIGVGDKSNENATTEERNAAALEAAIDEYGEDSPQVHRMKLILDVDDKSAENATTQERNAAALEAAIDEYGEDSPQVHRLERVLGIKEMPGENATTQERNAAALEATIKEHGANSDQVERLKKILGIGDELKEGSVDYVMEKLHEATEEIRAAEAAGDQEALAMAKQKWRIANKKVLDLDPEELEKRKLRKTYFSDTESIAQLKDKTFGLMENVRRAMKLITGEDTIEGARKKAALEISASATTGYTGKFMSMVSTSDRANLENEILTIKGNVALSILNGLREASQSGSSGLGQLNQSELDVLKAVMGSLDLFNPVAALKTLRRVDREFPAIYERLNKVYQRKYRPIMSEYEDEEAVGEPERTPDGTEVIDLTGNTVSGGQGGG